MRLSHASVLVVTFACSMARAEEPRDGLLPVDFIPNHPSSSYRVRIHGDICETPCRLHLPPGTHEVHVKGDGEVELSFDLADRGGYLKVQHPHTATIIAGIVCLVAGTAMIAVGHVGFFVRDAFFLLPLFAWGLGPVTHAIGVPTLVAGLARLVGANRFVPMSGQASRRSSRPGLQLIGAGLAPAASGVGLGVGFAF